MSNSKDNKYIEVEGCGEENCTAIINAELKNDSWNIGLLLVLYVMQGLPRTLVQSIQLMLQKRHATYGDQATYILAVLPFGFKLLWAPIVECFYSNNFGQRKSWLIPVQFGLGLCFFVLSMFGDKWLGDEDGQKRPNITFLTTTFVVVNILAATQDIVVDSWALKLLRRENIGHVATCDYIGRHIGELIGYVLFTVLISSSDCNPLMGNSSKSTNGVITLSGFTFFWSCIYFVVTLLIWIFKNEEPTPKRAINKNGIRSIIIESYRTMWNVLKIKPLRTLCLIALTSKIGFGVLKSVTTLKLSEYVCNSYVALVNVPLMPLQALLPFILKRYMIGPRSLDCFAQAMIFRCFTALGLGVFMFFLSSMKRNESYPVYLYILMFLVLALDDMGHYGMVISFQSYSARISDTSLAATYVTILNTSVYLGLHIPEILSVKLKPMLTWKFDSCKMESENRSTILTLMNRLQCSDIFDGYYIEIACGIVFTILWLKFWGKQKIRQLQNLKESSWWLPKVCDNEIGSTLL